MKTNRRIFRAGRHVQPMTALRSDSYHDWEKYHEPTACPECGASYRNGRWTWSAPDEDSIERLCPACQRIHDQFPAGYVTLKGKFARDHREEIIAAVRGCELREKAEHPMQRIIAINDVAAGIEVQTTDGHLARGIAEALCDAYKGRAQVRYAKDENLVRAVWERAAST